MKTKLEINNRLGELSEELQLGITRFINSIASHSFSSTEILKELEELHDRLVDKWRFQQQDYIMTDRYNFVVDLLNETTALTESNKLNIPVIALADSNVNPDNVDIVIPGNDDAIRSIELIASSIADSCLKGLGKRKEVPEKKDAE